MLRQAIDQEDGNKGRGSTLYAVWKRRDRGAFGQLKDDERKGAESKERPE
jgi:hypothetical protein